MLRVSLLGNMGADPEVRYTAKGTQIVAIRVAVNQVRTGPDGERQESTEWFRVRVAGRQSEFVQRLSKGTRVLAIGRLDISHYQSRDGEQRTSFEVWADDVQAMSRQAPSEPDLGHDVDAEAAEPAAAGVSSVSGRASNGRGTRASPRGGAPATAATTEDLEDLPF